MGERACVYTALFGQYEDLLEQPSAAVSDVDFVCFSDDPELESDSWEIRIVEPIIATDPARSSRYPKLCPHRFLPEYDISMYIDNAVLLTRSPEEVISDLLPADAGFSGVEHSFRETVLDEFDAVIQSGYEAEWVCDEQLAHYRRSHPEVMSMKPLIGGVLIRRHMRPDVIAAMERWWVHVLRFSRRDQLSLRMALVESSLSPVTWTLDVRDSGYWVWPSSTGRDRSRGGALPNPSVSDSPKSRMDREQSVLRLEAELLQRDDALARALAENDALAQELTKLSGEAAELKSSEAALIRRLDALRASASWRYTAWLRRLRRWSRQQRR